MKNQLALLLALTIALLLACTPAELQKLETARSTAEAECAAAKTDYEVAKTEYVEYRQLTDDGCKIASLLPDAIDAVSLAPIKRLCGKASVLDSLAKRVDRNAQRAERICSAVKALGSG